MSREEDRARAALRRAGLVATGGDPGEVPEESAEGYGELPPQLVRTEIEAVLMGDAAHRGLDRLNAEGALAALLPEVAALVGFGEGGRHHKDVWDHTKRVVMQSPRSPVLRWAALLHDVGKVPTRRTQPDGQVTFHGHAEVGARMTRVVLGRLAFDKPEANRIRKLVLFHLRANQYEPGWTDSAVRRFGREIGDLLGDLLDLSRADMTTKYEDKRRRGLDQIDELARRAAEIQEQDAKEPPLPKGFGQLIIERFQLRPGPLIGIYRDTLGLAIDTGRLDPRQDAEVYLAWLDARRAALEGAAAGEGPGPRGDAEAYLDWLDGHLGAV